MHQINKPTEYRKMLMLLMYRSFDFVLFTGQERLHKTHIVVDKTRKYYLNMLQMRDCAVYSNNYLKGFKRNLFACLQDETNSLRLFRLAISGLNIMKYVSHRHKLHLLYSGCYTFFLKENTLHRNLVRRVRKLVKMAHTSKMQNKSPIQAPNPPVSQRTQGGFAQNCSKHTYSQNN